MMVHNCIAFSSDLPRVLDSDGTAVVGFISRCVRYCKSDAVTRNRIIHGVCVETGRHTVSIMQII